MAIEMIAFSSGKRWESWIRQGKWEQALKLGEVAYLVFL